MLSADQALDLARVLPGSWTVRATNFPMWLGGDRLNPRFTYGLLGDAPLTLSDDVSYSTREGVEKHVIGTDRWSRDTFVWRGKGLLNLAKSRWTIVGASEDGSALTIRFEPTVATPAGIDVIVREGVDLPELRTTVAHNTDRFGLTAEDFGTLTWLAPVMLPAPRP